MADRLTIQINSILGGFTPIFQQAGRDQYLDAIGIDPELTGFGGVVGVGLGGSNFGAIIPNPSLAVLTTSTLGEAPMWISGSANTAGVFIYGSAGSVYALNGTTLALDGDGSQWKPTSGAGNGMIAYNDYIYFSTPTDIFRLGRISQTGPTMASWWVTGLSNSALVNTTYQNSRSITYPNHVMHFHNDGKIYVADYDNATGDSPHGGLIHWFKTSTDGTGGTSGYAALVLPPGFMPTAIESYGTDLAILCSPQSASGGTARSGSSALFLWDTINATYYRHITIKEQAATAMKVKNGQLYIWSGNMGTDFKLIKYLGGNSFQTLVARNYSDPPPQCAVEIFGDMICWGAYVFDPATAAGVFSYGYRSGQLKPVLHMPYRITDTTNTLPVVSCVKSIRQQNLPVIGWRTDTAAAYGLDKAAGGSQQASRFRTQVYNIGKQFRIKRITIPITKALTAGDSIVPTIYVDNQFASTTLATINTTNYPDSRRIIDINTISVSGYANFYIDFSFTGTNLLGMTFPIKIYIETDEL